MESIPFERRGVMRLAMVHSILERAALSSPSGSGSSGSRGELKTQVAQLEGKVVKTEERNAELESMIRELQLQLSAMK